MKLTISHTTFSDVVAFASRGLPARPPVPVLAGLKLTADAAGLAVAGYDYEASTRATAPGADIGEPGSVLVSGRLLADISRALRQDVYLSSDGVRLVVESGSARFTLHTLPLEEYPTLPESPGPSGTVAGAELAHAVAQVAVAAGRDDTLPVLTGIRIEATEDSLTLSSTDRYRFAVRSLPWNPTDASSAGAHALVPAKTLLDTAKALAGDTEVSIALPGKQEIIGFAGGTRRTTTRILGGDLPGYRTLFPTEFAAQAVVDIKGLVAAAKRVALVAERNTPLRLTFSHDGVTIEGGSSDDAQAVDRVSANLEGDQMVIAFNPGFLLDGLSAIGAGGSERARFCFTSPTKPAVLRGDSTPEAALKYLLMPVRLNG
ncbi:DNA polymerase III subunit beta [Streptomyces sp. MP131-18]|uniref:DNA polymerase III subunit beta n=1 Tax=Streptomyces sp. MP131-18 TaxID=1857892 RepID=UPI00097CB379|nr:DNA polymerase III subunit beta [Streptomyces sp. MP131-18]ONK09288.1 DNA polymerase III subunit beta [Streptomyces sp. MP131-18]